MKGVILAGGRGTRLMPFTKRLNKGMSPIYTPGGAIPQILFPLMTLVNSGITEIMIITSRDHCGQMVELLGDGTEYNCSLSYRIQEMDRPITGIAQALGLAEDFVINSSSFAVILGDNYYEQNFHDVFTVFDKKCKETFLKSDMSGHLSHIFLKEVHDPERFGVASLDENSKVTKIIEKPKEPETNFAVTGLYLYNPTVFNIIKHLKPSNRKELEITDVNNAYVNLGNMSATILNSFWHDMGTPEAAKEVCDYLWKNNA